MIESSTGALKSPFDKILFESEKKSANTPYGPSPFSSVTVTISPQVATATSGLPSFGGVSQQPATNSKFSSFSLNFFIC